MNFIRICSAFYRVRFNYLFTRIELLNTTAIPDSNFEQALINLGFDSAPINGSVPTANISSVTSLNVRNGNNPNFTDFYSSNNPNLTCIYVDDASYSTANWTNIDATTTFVNNEAACGY